MRLIPRNPVPTLAVAHVEGGQWDLASTIPSAFKMIAYYRGNHFPICRGWLGSLQKLLSEFASRGTAGVLLAMLVFAGCNKPDEAKPGEKPAPTVSIAQPTRRTVTDWDEFTGRFQAVETVDIRARVSGYLQSVGFKDGALVKQGDPLFVIDPRPYEAAVMQATGLLQETRSRVALGELEVLRGQTLSQSQTIAQSALDQRRQTLQAAQAAQSQAEAALKRAQLDLEFTHIRSPISGRISRHLVSVGNLVQGGDAGSTLLTSVVSLDPIEVYFDMDERTYLKNTRLWLEGRRPTSRDTANPVQISLPDETKASRVGQMNFVDNRLDTGTGTLRGRATVLNADLSLVPGQFARVRLIGSAPYEGLLVPDSAVATDQSRRIVYVLDKDDVVAARPVVLGPIDDGLRVVREGLRAEDRIVVTGLQRIKVGLKVKPENAKPEPSASKP